MDNERIRYGSYHENPLTGNHRFFLFFLLYFLLFCVVTLSQIYACDISNFGGKLNLVCCTEII